MGSIAIEFAIVIPVVVLILFGSLDLLRLFQLTTLLDSRTEYLADYFSKPEVPASGHFALLIGQLQLSTDWELTKLSGAVNIVRLLPGGGSVSLKSERSDTVLADCFATSTLPHFQNEGGADFFPSQIFVQVSLCLKPENGFYLSPVIKNLAPLIAAKATRSVVGLSVAEPIE